MTFSATFMYYQTLLVNPLCYTTISFSSTGLLLFYRKYSINRNEFTLSCKVSCSTTCCGWFAVNWGKKTQFFLTTLYLWLDMLVGNCGGHEWVFCRWEGWRDAAVSKTAITHSKTVHCWAQRNKLSFRTDDARTGKVICRKRYVTKCCLEVQGGS